MVAWRCWVNIISYADIYGRMILVDLYWGFLTWCEIHGYKGCSKYLPWLSSFPRMTMLGWFFLFCQICEVENPVFYLFALFFLKVYHYYMYIMGCCGICNRTMDASGGQLTWDYVQVLKYFVRASIKPNKAYRCVWLICVGMYWKLILEWIK